MRSKTSLLRRSGVALYNVANQLGWSPTMIFQVGIGCYYKEVEVFQEAWPEADLIGWEPFPSVVQLRDYPGLLVRKALGRHVGKVRLFWDPAHVNGASIYHDPTNPRLESAEVEMDVLDNYYDKIAWKQADERPLLWLDCEGSELDVLVGGEKFVSEIDVINVELTGRPLRASWPSAVMVNRWLLDHGFLLQFVHTQRMASSQVDAIYVRPNLFLPEYCCCPLQVEAWYATEGKS